MLINLAARLLNYLKFGYLNSIGNMASASVTAEPLLYIILWLS